MPEVDQSIPPLQDNDFAVRFTIKPQRDGTIVDCTGAKYNWNLYKARGIRPALISKGWDEVAQVDRGGMQCVFDPTSGLWQVVVSIFHGDTKNLPATARYYHECVVILSSLARSTIATGTMLLGQTTTRSATF